MIDFTGTKIEDRLLEINIKIDEADEENKMVNGASLKTLTLYTPKGWSINSPLLILSAKDTIGSTAIDLSLSNNDYCKSYATYDLRDLTDPTKSIDLKKTPIIVEVEFTGTFKDNIPCFLLKNKEALLVYDKRVIHKNSIGFLRSLNGCTPNKEFIDYMLNLKALELAATTCNYLEAAKIWDRIVGILSSKPISNCGCHG